MRRALPGLGLGVLLGAGCGGGPPQAKDEAAVVYRAAFTSAGGVNTTVIFPFPVDGAELQVQQNLMVSDGGTARVENTAQGLGLAVEGFGHVEASFSAPKLSGLGNGGIPEAALSRPVPDAGTEERYFHVNKGGSGSTQIDFEYSATRDCGEGCGGKRSWTFQGPVGLSLQAVTTSFVEETRQ